MQTGLQLFDLSVLGASVKGQKTMPAFTKQTGDAKSDQMAGFMEIMSALLALPQEQWKSSLAGLDAMPSDGDSETFPCLIENAEQDVTPSELLTLVMNMKGAVIKEFQTADAEGKLHPLLDMAKALMDDPQIAATGSVEESKETLKAALTIGDDHEATFSQTENAVQDGLEINLDGNGESRLFPGMEQVTEKSKNPLAVEVELDSENKSPADASPVLKPAAMEKDASKTSRHPDAANNFLFQASDAQTDGASNQDSEKVKSSLAAGIAKTPVTDNLPDQESRVADKEHQPLAAADVRHAGLDAPTHVEGENQEEHLVQRPVTPAGGQQGLLSRPETGQDAKGMAISGDKEVMPQEKTEQSDVIRQIVQRMSMHTVGGQSKMVISLKPEFLGNVHMHVLTENHQVTVRMMAESTLVKDIVEQNLQHLRTELQHHGLEIQKFDVFVANDDKGWRSGQEQAGFRDTLNQKQPRSGGGKSKHRREKVMFDAGNGKKIVQKDPGEIDYFA
jgi:flagellar hook-length control protein FliK